MREVPGRGRPAGECSAWTAGGRSPASNCLLRMEGHSGGRERAPEQSVGWRETSPGGRQKLFRPASLARSGVPGRGTFPGRGRL